jgi:hypothetical protein
MIAGSNNPIVQDGDSGIVFDGGTKDTGNFVIAPWATGISGLRMTAEGNVGISTANPAVKLHAYSSSDEVARFQSNGNPYISLYNAAGARQSYFYSDSSAIQVVAESSKPLWLRGATTLSLQSGGSTSPSMFFMDASGNIGIGTSVTNGNKLSVNGATAITGSVLPGSSNTYDLGSSSKNWSAVYASTGSFGDVSISGNLTVAGTQTIINTDILNIKDNAILVNAAPSPQSTGGIYVADTTANTTGSLVWDTTTDTWKAGKLGSETTLVSGSGTTNYVTKWAGSNHVGTSVMYDDGTNVGVGTATSNNRFNVYTAGTNGTDGLRVFGGATTSNVRIRPAMSAGANNSIVAAGDSGIIFDGGSVDTGAFVIAPWATGTPGFRMTAAGNVGIGTVTPVSNANYTGLTVGGTNGSTYSHMTGGDEVFRIQSDVSGVTIATYTSGLTALPLNFKTNNTQALTIDTSQNVGIGTTSSASTYKLHIYKIGASAYSVIQSSNANAYLNLLGSSGGAMSGTINVENGALNVGTTTNHPVVIGANSNEWVRIAATGEVGIGTSSTGGERLRIYNASGNTVGIYSNTSNSSLSLSGYNSTTPVTLAAEVTSTVANLGTATNHPVNLLTNGTTALTINTSQNVGIGTTSSDSTYKLHVYKSGASAYSVIQSSNANACLYLLGTYSSTAMSGTINVENGAMNVGTSTNHPLVIGTNGSEWVRVTSAGKVGIGTTSPSGNLQLESGEAWFKTTADTSSYTHLNYGAAGDNYISSGNDSFITVGQTTIRGKSVGGAQTDIAYFTVAGTSPRVGIGTAALSYYLKLGADSAAKPSTNTWTVASDMRLKENIETIKNPLERILQLRGVEFDWKPGLYGVDVVHDGGFIAQELEESFPHWVRESETSEEEKSYIPSGMKKDFAMRNDFYALTVESFRALKEENDLLKSENEEIKKLISDLQNQVTDLVEVIGGK